MDYESFKEKFVEDVKDRLYERGAEVDLSIHTVNKLNESYEAITVTPEGSNIGVNIGIDKFYGAVEDGRPYNEVVDKAVDVINNGINQRPDFDIESLSDYSQMKEKLAMEVVSAEANEEMLETVPHQNMEDMAVVYRFVLSSDDDSRASILVTDQLLENMGVTPEQLHADAMENAPQIKPVEIKGMSKVLAEMMGVEQAEMMGLFAVAPEDEKIYVATVPDKVHGAGVLAYQNFMDQAAERAGGDFFILPSSFNQFIISIAKSFLKDQRPNNYIDRSVRSGCLLAIKNGKIFSSIAGKTLSANVFAHDFSRTLCSLSVRLKVLSANDNCCEVFAIKAM